MATVTLYTGEESIQSLPITSCHNASAQVASYSHNDVNSSLGVGYSFTPVAIETLGAMGKKSLAFLKDLGHRVRQRTGEVKAKAYQTQRLSVAVQRGNAASVLGSVGGRPELEDLF